MRTEFLVLSVGSSGRLTMVSTEILRIALKADDLLAFSRWTQINELGKLVHDQRARQQSGYNFMDVLNPRNL